MDLLVDLGKRFKKPQIYHALHLEAIYVLRITLAEQEGPGLVELRK